ncbi:uncharacterized protein LOC120895658 [Anopheles arabiensis]|nr:uncharacterized protein LOC5667409 [Anopheles gambiae]XP_040155127.1 uncharacterized protein LOC120895658 [Anopheles arabiensis]XP_040225654.1 uncharacterized protein LOC120951169 [Anopheles coluzzii]XP_041765519.1 uncharacterized protein LOC121590156 [Anopheles merus]
MLIVKSDSTLKFVPSVRLINNLNIRKGSRTGNSGNHLEFQVLTQIQYVP